jgi:hypothetical protein
MKTRYLLEITKQQTAFIEVTANNDDQAMELAHQEQGLINQPYPPTTTAKIIQKAYDNEP